MSTRGERRRAGLSAGLAIAALALLMTSATACGGSAATPTNEGSIPQASPSVAAAPQRLAGTDSVAVTQQAVDAYAAAWDAQSAAQLGALYARDVVFDCFATGVHVDGRAALLKMLKEVCAMTTGTRALAGHADRGWAALELRQDFAEGSVQLLQLVETRDGKIVRHANYYQPIEGRVSPLRVANPLRSAPGPADTTRAAEALALAYAAALQNKDAAAMAALSTPTIAFADTASSTVGSSPGEVAEALRQDLQDAGRPGLRAPALRRRPRLGGRHLDCRQPVARGERQRRDHAGAAQRQDRPRDALLQQFQRPVLATGSGRAGRLEIQRADGEGRGHEGAPWIQ